MKKFFKQHGSTIISCVIILAFATGVFFITKSLRNKPYAAESDIQIPESVGTQSDIPMDIIPMQLNPISKQNKINDEKNAVVALPNMGIISDEQGQLGSKKLSVAETHFRAAMADIVAGNPESALSNLNNAIILDASNGTIPEPLPDNQLKMAYWLHGETQWQLRTEQNDNGVISDQELSDDLKNVIYNFSQAIALDTSDQYLPSNERILNRRAQLYIMFGMYDAALNDFSQALQLDPKYLVTYYYRGKMKLMYTQDKQGGCDDLRMAYNDPNDRDGELNRSIVGLMQSLCVNFPALK